MKLRSLAAALVLAGPAAASSLIEPFATCEDLSKYYVVNLLPLVHSYGVSTSSAYVRARTPSYMPDDPNTIGGPAGMWLGEPGGNPPKRVGFSNITSSDGPEDADAAAAARDNGQVAGVDFSTTNNQVEGVDEPDIIKTDGKRVFTLSNSLFSAVEVLDGGKSGQRTGKIKLPTYAFEMLYQGDWVLAIGTAYGYKRPLHQRYQVDPTDGAEATVVYQINVADISNPRLVATLQLEGNYVESREVDGVARMIVSFDPLRSMQMFRASDHLGFSEEQTKKWNQEIVQYSAPGHWMPTYQLSRNGQVQAGTYADCHAAYYSTQAFSGFKMLSVVTLPIDGFLAPQGSASVLSDAEKVYSTTDSLYVTTSEFQRDDTDSSRWGGEYLTSFHKFGMTNAGANFLASGSVSGSVLNQFSMHENNGIFFIATTEGASWWGNRDLSKSKVTSYEYNEESRQLVQIGEAGNLGLGERIYAVRYLDDTAYVVTFRQIDPLYIIDLADPRNLKVTGELKIPGFSSYLHYVGKGRILGVGQEATPEGRTVGAKVSLFDVSDKTSPKEVSSWILDRSSTGAQWDHRAFLFWWREGIAVMPVNQYSSESRFVGAVILDVTENEIKERGRVTQKVEGKSYEESIKRNAIVGGTNLWSMSNDYLQVNDVNSLDDVTAQVSIKDD